MKRIATLTLALLLTSGLALLADTATPPTPTAPEVGDLFVAPPIATSDLPIESLLSSAQPSAAYPTACDLACTATCQKTEPGSLGICTRGYCICFS